MTSSEHTHFTVVYTAAGQFQAEIMRSFLETDGLTVRLSQESAGAVYAFTMGPLGEVEVLVPAAEVERAQALIDAYERGDFDSNEEAAGSDEEAG